MAKSTMGARSRGRVGSLNENWIRGRVYTVRGYKVMLDRDMAELYGVDLEQLREAVAKNDERFPDDFMLQLTRDETYTLVSQNVIPLKRSLDGNLPYVFTEMGVAMLSCVLDSESAIQVSRIIMELTSFMSKLDMTAGERDSLPFNIF